MAAPAIHIGPDDKPYLTRAVEEGGGRPVPLEQAEGVIWAGGPGAFPELPGSVRWVQLPAAGVEIWMDEVNAAPDVEFTSAGGVYAVPVAELALGLLIAGVRGLAHHARVHTWDPQDTGTLEGSTVAIIGAGGIGRALIAMLEPHDVEVIAVTRSGRDVPGAARSLSVEALEEVWGAADHFVIAAPATEATRHIVGAAELAAMPSHAWVVNVARGSLIDTDALVDALQDGSIAGAALDVTDPEPLPDGHPLWSSERVLITPHVANPRSASERHLAKRVTENVRRFGAGEELLAPVERERGY
jgi:D-3-phosphoglycerate dehydrogenase